MRHIICEECKRRYDYDRDEFCPRCGAFNQPVKVWETDSQGNIRRVDGVNEQNHANSFVHREVHAEKRERRAKGMDQPRRPAQERPQPARRQAPASGTMPPKKDGMVVIKVIFWIIGIITLVNFLLPLLMAALW